MEMFPEPSDDDQNELTKRVDTRSSRLTGRNFWPRLGLPRNTQVLIERGHLGTEIFEKQVWRNHTMLHGERSLQQACYASSSLSMANDGLETADKEFFASF